MASAPVLVSNEGAVPTPNGYTVPPGLDFIPDAVTAVFNGASAGGAFLACLSFYSQDGLLLARTFPETPLNAGDSAEVTYAPFLDSGGEATPAGPSADTGYVSAVLADGPYFFYRFNETSGLPQDSSGNGFHMTNIVGVPQYVVPGARDGWLAIQLDAAFVGLGMPASSNAAFTNEFWTYVSGAPSGDFALCQHGAGGLSGLSVQLRTSMKYRGIAEGVSVLADGSTLSAGTWYYSAIVWDGAVWTYYLNGAVDVANAGVAVPGIPSGTSGAQAANGTVARISHWAWYLSALSPATIAAHYAAAAP